MFCHKECEALAEKIKFMFGSNFAYADIAVISFFNKKKCSVLQFNEAYDFSFIIFVPIPKKKNQRQKNITCWVNSLWNPKKFIFESVLYL